MLITQYTALLLQSVKRPAAPAAEDGASAAPPRPPSTSSSSSSSLEALQAALEEPRLWLLNEGYVGPKRSPKRRHRYTPPSKNAVKILPWGK